eukprot:710127-Pleurochrysis_carterae.AAC.1
MAYLHDTAGFMGKHPLPCARMTQMGSVLEIPFFRGVRFGEPVQMVAAAMHGTLTRGMFRHQCCMHASPGSHMGNQGGMPVAQLYVTDTSSNGTFVNGVRLAKKEPTRVSAGDVRTPAQIGPRTHHRHAER